MNTEAILHEMKGILAIHRGIKGIEGRRSAYLRDRIAERSMVLLNEIISDPKKICLLDCPYKKDGG